MSLHRDGMTVCRDALQPIRFSAGSATTVKPGFSHRPERKYQALGESPESLLSPVWRRDLLHSDSECAHEHAAQRAEGWLALVVCPCLRWNGSVKNIQYCRVL